MHFVLTKKFSDSNWKLLGWIVYISLVAISVWFTWGALDKFAKQETAIRQYEDKIEAHPTIAICLNPSAEYQKYFNISYATHLSDGLSVEDDIILKIGENYLENSGENVTLTIMYTRYSAMCYTMNTTRNIDERGTEIKILSSNTLGNMPVFFTSEKNSYGNTRSDWRDGEVYSFIISSGTKKDITLTVEKTINLKCSEESFYEYVATKLSEQSFALCNNKCLMTSLPNDPYQVCPNYKEWYEYNWAKPEEVESDCNWSIVRDLIKNITDNDQHLKTCITTKYFGLSQESSGVLNAEIKYKFSLPLKAKVYEEYFIIDSIGLIGSVGGTLGLFTGFCLSDMIICIIEYIQSLMERKLRSRKKFIKIIWKCLKWIIFLFLMASAILFARKVIEKYFGQNKGIKQNMEKIELHPTITICPFQEQFDINITSLSYDTELNFTYLTFESDGLTPEEEINLKLGETQLSLAKEKVSLIKIYTRWNGICYKINTTREADFRKTEIKLETSESKTLGKTELFFTSEENSYGTTNNKFMDGKAFSMQLNGGTWNEIYLSVEKNMNLECNKESFYEYVASALSQSNFKNCTHSCLRTSLPNEKYPICLNYEDWFGKRGNLTEPEDDCNWSIVRDLIEDIITMDERLKTCSTIEYSGKIMTEKNDQASNELLMQYKFAFPLRAKVYQEFLITDAIDLVGSVGGTIGMFIGFSFSSIITCIMGYIGTFLASRKKLPESIWVSIEWIFYLSFVAIAIWFAWGVLDKFFKQDTGIQQHEEKIESHPTIVICMSSWKYEADFYINYAVEGPNVNVGNNLKIGDNYLATLKETISLTTIYTRYNGLCYAIKTTQKVDDRGIFIRILPSSTVDNLPGAIPVFFTSDLNSYGVTLKDWRDGEGFSFITSGGNIKQIDMTVEKYINLKCSNQSFYEYVASRLSEEKFEKCNETCLMTSLPNDSYLICPNYDEWFGQDAKRKESNCNWNILSDLIQNITVNEEHLKTCVTTQYLGKITFDSKFDIKFIQIVYKFPLPLKAQVYEEYLITDGITLVGSVGGTLGLFIGFSMSNVVYSIMDYFKSKCTPK